MQRGIRNCGFAHWIARLVERAKTTHCDTVDELVQGFIVSTVVCVNRSDMTPVETGCTAVH